MEMKPPLFSVKDYDLEIDRNQIYIRKNMVKQITDFENLFEIQQRLFHYHVAPGFAYIWKDQHRISIQAFYKNIRLLHASHNLIIGGNYGATNVLVRQIFEFLLIGKAFYYEINEGKARGWLNGKQWNVHKMIIRQLEKPQQDIFHDFWCEICDYCHATPSSYQLFTDAKGNEDTLVITHLVLLMFLRCNYHLLLRCVLNRGMQYQSDYYGKKIENSQLKKNGRLMKSSIYAQLPKKFQQIVTKYEMPWKFKCDS